jgi:hypothetical protein
LFFDGIDISYLKWPPYIDLLDGHVCSVTGWHLRLQVEFELISTKSMQLLVLRRHTKEFNPGPFPFDPIHSRQINSNRRNPVIRVHHERNVLTAPQAFRQPQPAPSRGNIRDLSTGKA